MDMLSLIEKTLLEQLSQDEVTWLTQSFTTLENSTDIENDLLNASVIVKRKFATQYALTSVIEQNKNYAALAHFDTSEVVRLLLLNKALAAINTVKTDCTAEQLKLLKQYYRLGDESEKCALLKSLSFLDATGYAVNIAINSTRCNSLIEFTALALHNDYPAKHFAELNFNQLVLKSLFMGLNISLINHLDTKLNEKLSNMCFAYAIEQALADRIPPATLWLALRYPDLTEEHLAEFNHYSIHFQQADEQHNKVITSLFSRDILQKNNDARN